MKHLIFVNGGIDGVEPIELSEESIQGAIEHYQSLLETIRHYNKQHAQEEFEKKRKECIEKIREARELRLKLRKEYEDESRAKKEKELMEKAAEFEAESKKSFSFGICESTLEKYKKDWSFLKYVDIRKALVNSLYYQGNEAIRVFLELKEFKEMLKTDGIFVLKNTIGNIIQHPTASGFMKDFCVLLETPEIKASVSCYAMLDFYRDLEQEKRDMYKYENFRHMMFILRTEMYGLNDGDFYTPYKNALIKEILGETND